MIFADTTPLAPRHDLGCPVQPLLRRDHLPLVERSSPLPSRPNGTNSGDPSTATIHGVELLRHRNGGARTSPGRDGCLLVYRNGSRFWYFRYMVSRMAERRPGPCDSLGERQPHQRFSGLRANHPHRRGLGRAHPFAVWPRRAAWCWTVLCRQSAGDSISYMVRQGMLLP